MISKAGADSARAIGAAGTALGAFERPVAYYLRLGSLVIERREPEMRMSRAVQICRTWRMHFAWNLTHALGWKRS